jgi:hypothetical protein
MKTLKSKVPTPEELSKIMSKIQYDDLIFKKMYESTEQRKTFYEVNVKPFLSFEKILLDPRFLDFSYEKRLADSFLTSYIPVSNENKDLLFRPAQRQPYDILQIQNQFKQQMESVIPSGVLAPLLKAYKKVANLPEDNPLLDNDDAILAKHILTVSPASNPTYVLLGDISKLTVQNTIFDCKQQTDIKASSDMNAWEYLNYLLKIVTAQEYNLQESIKTIVTALYTFKTLYKEGNVPTVEIEKQLTGQNVGEAEKEGREESYIYARNIIKQYRSDLMILYKENKILKQLIDDAMYNNYQLLNKYLVDNGLDKYLMIYSKLKKSSADNLQELNVLYQDQLQMIETYRKVIIYLDLYFEKIALIQVKQSMKTIAIQAKQILKDEGLSDLLTYYDMILQMPDDIIMLQEGQNNSLSETCDTRILCIEFESFIKLLAKQKYDLKGLVCK